MMCLKEQYLHYTDDGAVTQTVTHVMMIKQPTLLFEFSSFFRFKDVILSLRAVSLQE